jgi:hypothetical protein
MIRFHGDTSVWPIIKEHIKKSKKSQQIFAAVAYVGSDAARIMPLRRGDVLVCNASDAAIEQGSTSAIALKSYFNRGVIIFNEPRLHGKLVVFPKRTFVGSANVSSRSRDSLFEAVVETTDPTVVGSSQRFVEHHAHAVSRLDHEDIKRMQRIPVKRPEPLPPPPPLPLLRIPKQVPLLKLVPVEFFNYSYAVKNEIGQQRKSIRNDFFDGGRSADVEAEEWHSDWWRVIQPDMWYVGVTKLGRIYKPKQVIKLSKVTKNRGVLWLAVPKEGKNFVKDQMILSRHGFKWDGTNHLVLRKKETEAILNLFRNY